MKDSKWPVVIDGITYNVQRTFSNDPAIYISVEPDTFIHINDYLRPAGGRKAYSAKIITAGLNEPDEAVILAHLAYNDVRPIARIIIDDKRYAVDMNAERRPAVFIAAGDETFYPIEQYGEVARSVTSLEDILNRPEYDRFNRRGQVIIIANAQLRF
jgi:hypothetical protein